MTDEFSTWITNKIHLNYENYEFLIFYPGHENVIEPNQTQPWYGIIYPYRNGR